MPRNGQDAAVAAGLIERGLADTRTLAEVECRAGALARRLIETRVVPAPLVSAVVRELGAGRFVCPGCGKALAYAALGKLASLSCPTCPSRLEFRDAEQPASSSGTPERIGPYRVERELGRGGMGIVYLARRASGDPVAIKVLLSSYAAGGGQRFEAEAETAGRLDHPGIVKVHATGVHAQRPYYVMDYVRGPTLAERIKREGPLSPVEAARVVRALALAVAEAHDAGVIHRDLKPGNVILSEATGAPVITDFGLARDLNRGLGMTRSGEVLGTPHYMAPEQMEDAKRVGTAADVYALGVILYECLTGRRPFEANALLDLYNQIMRGRPAPVRDAAPATPPALERVCLSALARDPDDRPFDARALADALAPGELAEVPAPASAGRRGVLVGVLAAGVGLLLLGGAAATVAWRQRAGGSASATPEPGVVATSPAPSLDPTPTDPADPFAVALGEVEALHRRSAPYPDIAAALDRVAPLAATPKQRSRLARARLELAFRRLRIEEALKLCRSPQLRDRDAREARLIEALVRYRQGRRAQAIAMTQALSSEPGVVGATAGALRSHWLGSNGPDPTRVARAMMLDPRFPLARLMQYFQLLIGGRDHRAARRVIDGLLAEAPDHFLFLWAQVTLLRRQDGDAAAVGALDRVVSLVQPTPFPEAVFVRCQLQTRLDDWTGALAGMNDVLRSPEYRDDVQAILFRGMVRGKSGDARGQRDDYVRAALADPRGLRAALDGAQLKIVLAVVAQRLRRPAGLAPVTSSMRAAVGRRLARVPEAARAPLRAATLLLMRGAPWSEALGAQLEAARAAAPRAFEVAVQRAELLGGRQQHAAAREALAEAAQRVPDEPGARARLQLLEGDLAARRGDEVAARVAYGRLLKGAGLEAQLARAALHAEAGGRDPKVGERAALKALELDPAHPRGYVLAAWFAHQREAHLEALRWVRRGALRGAAIDGLLYGVQSLALCHLQALCGRMDFARRELDWSLELGGGWLRAVAAGALIKYRRDPENLRWARATLREGLRLEPKRARLHRLLGLVSFVEQRPADEVLAHYERAKAIEPRVSLRTFVRGFRQAYPQDAKRLAPRLERLTTGE